MPEVSLQLFFSYSHKDEALRDELANHLSILTRQGVISSWHDRKILPGEERDRQINENLNTADIILLLISSDFIASNYCWDVEVTTAIERHNAGEACVIPIILRRVDWSGTPFAKLQSLPKNAEPITSWTNRDDAFANVAQGIRTAAEQLIEKRQQKLALVIKEAAIAEYRQQAEEFAADGEISFVESEILKDLQKRLGLTDQEARTVRDKVLEPYGRYKENLDKYRQIFTKLVDEQGYPLGEKAKADLKKLQQYLKITDEDIAFLDKEAEAQKQQQEAERLRQERERAEYQKQQAELQKQTARESSKPVVSPQSSAGIHTQPFEFDTATITVRSGFLGIKTYEINYSRKRAKFFKEDLKNGVVLEMVAIPGGQFLMGSPKDELERDIDESPQHNVTIQSFFMGKFPVTQSQWTVIASLPKVNLELNSDPSNFKGANRPVERVSWDDAVEFCARLSNKTGKSYRLPSEAEWEYACRAGTTTPFYFGETITTDLANYRGTDWNYQETLYPGNYCEGPKGEFRKQTTDVGKFSPNPFGLHDMHGNIFEWCQDGWHKNYNAAPTDGSAWISNNNYRMLRGGSWYYNPKLCRSAFRLIYDAGSSYSNYGFRVACSGTWT
ncbi:hypothetical protein A6770_33640 [Nostoc minutum NIES-26]|uniref:TIR domain-containing protein n=1 Tax=Nostoc minutum NIES-26 TaxID=1844469 RepID=A0A367Q374_9NOSO|nr:hypothetical protein A6770_33640 [Nostoc minutum NIES-26]